MLQLLNYPARKTLKAFWLMSQVYSQHLSRFRARWGGKWTSYRKGVGGVVGNLDKFARF